MQAGSENDPSLQTAATKRSRTVQYNFFKCMLLIFSIGH